MFMSIVTPFFNRYEDVYKCIMSLESQTCKDFELILIDDASTEFPLNRVKKVIQNATLDILLLHNEKNHGPGYSRNKGIQAASGDYILFLDSDDWLDNNTVYILRALTANENFDCVLFDYFILKKKMVPYSLMKKFQQGNIDKLDALLYSSGSMLCKMYRTNIVQKNNIQFPDIYIKEDMVFNKLTLACCSTIYYLKENLYYYNMQQNSLMHSSKAFNVNNDIIAFNILEEKLCEFPDVLEGLFLSELLYAGTFHMVCSQHNKIKVFEFYSQLRKKYPFWIKSVFFQGLPLRMQIYLYGLYYKQWWLLKIMAFVKLNLKK